MIRNKKYHLIRTFLKVIIFKRSFYGKSSNIMRAVRIHSLGGPSVLQIDYNLPIPKPAKNEILVKVKAAGVNPVDTYMRQGINGYNPSVPIILGKEASGEVECVGAEVKEFKKGDRVICALSHGAYSEFITCDKDSVIPLPDRFNFSQGAALYISYFTAYRALVTKCKIKKGELVLVHGASGSVGTAGVQIAKAHGLTVIGTAGTAEGLETVKKNGADYVIDHREENHLQKILQEIGQKGFDVILENRACLNLNDDMKFLREKGRIGVVGSRDTLEVNPRHLISHEGTVIGVRLNAISEDEFKEYSKVLLKGVEDGWVKPVIAEEYTMEDIPQAHVDVIRENGAKGKLILLLNQKRISVYQQAKD